MWLPPYLGYGSDDLPVLSGQTWRSDGHPRVLAPPLGVDISGVFLGVSSAGQDDVGHWCSYVTMVTLVDDEALFRQVGPADAAAVSSQEEQDFGWIFPDGLYTCLVSQVQRSHLTGNSTHTHTHANTLSTKLLSPANCYFAWLSDCNSNSAPCVPVQDIKDFPALFHSTAGSGILSDGRDGTQDGSSVSSLQSAAAHDYYWTFGRWKHLETEDKEQFVNAISSKMFFNVNFLRPLPGRRGVCHLPAPSVLKPPLPDGHMYNSGRLHGLPWQHAAHYGASW